MIYFTLHTLMNTIYLDVLTLSHITLKCVHNSKHVNVNMFANIEKHYFIIFI